MTLSFMIKKVYLAQKVAEQEELEGLATFLNE